MELQGKTAIVTGAGSGIGKEVALLFAQEGAKLVLVDYDQDSIKELEKTMQAAKYEVKALACDISKPDEVVEMVARSEEYLGNIEILINSAGISSIDEPKMIHETDLKVWNKIIGTNLTGTFLVCKYVLSNMIRNKKGNIVNFGSTYSFLGASKFGPYASSKGGIMQLTKSIAREYAQYNIVANLMIPGYIDTPMLQKDMAKESEPDIQAQKVLEHIPLNRLGTAAEMAQVILYLASDRACYMTGSLLIADGGYSIM